MGKFWIKVLRILAVVWLVLAGSIILLGHLMILITDGFGALQEVLSPFNIINYVVIFLVLSPGIGAWYLSERLQRRSNTEMEPK
ncbi:MAG: hypothetical protein IPH73_04050 [Rhodocyclales bacterium]|nr:hypothetical protein [Rhodocyclales bacterium]